MLTLLCCLTAAAQAPTVTKCEYWFDQQFDSRTTETMTSDTWNSSIDISSLNAGLHSIAFRVADSNGQFSSTAVKNFVLVPGTGTGDNSLQTYEYWFDQNFAGRKSGSIPASGVINIDEDISALDNGLHNIAMRVIDKNGIVSSVLVKNFMKVPQMDGSNELQTYEYWIDDAFDERTSGAVPEGGVVNLDLDIVDLAQGLHTFNYLTRDKAGVASGVVTKQFFVKKVEGEGKLVGVDYWFNDGPRTRIAIDPAQASIDKDDVVIPMDGVQPRTIAEDYTFDATTKTVVTKGTITVGIQVFNDAEVGSEAVVETLENMSFTVDPSFVALSNEVGDTKAAPKGGQMQGFSYTGAVGDSLHWEITNEVGAKVDFYDADGNVITPEAKTIDEKDVLVMKMPTESVYVLVYGAMQDGDITIKVAQPIELAVIDATRAYGEENPTFTYSTKGATVAGEVAFTTEATAASGVGEYAVSIDGSGITNSYVTLKSGKLTITKAKLTITADDIEVHQDEEMPVLTWKAEGWKNGEDESVLTVQPVCTTEGTPDSPLGDYTITISGAEAANYDITYVDGKLTVSVPVGIASFSANVAPADIYTLQGIKVRSKAESLDGLAEGYYIVNRRKVFIRRR